MRQYFINLHDHSKFWNLKKSLVSNKYDLWVWSQLNTKCIKFTFSMDHKSQEWQRNSNRINNSDWLLHKSNMIKGYSFRFFKLIWYLSYRFNFIWNYNFTKDSNSEIIIIRNQANYIYTKIEKKTHFWKYLYIPATIFPVKSNENLCYSVALGKPIKAYWYKISTKVYY